MQVGKVYLVGAGPGDLGLVTLRAKELIQSADVLVYDALINQELVNWSSASCEKINAGKRSGDHILGQDQINELLVQKAKEGKKVVRLKGGDPFIFGRGGEEAEVLVDNGVEFEIVPGVSSAIAGPAYAGIPVTHRKYATQVTISTGHFNAQKQEENWQNLGGLMGTKVVLMGMENLPEIVSNLIAGGQNSLTPSAVIQWATTSRQRQIIAPLEKLVEVCQKEKIQAPAIVVVGDVVETSSKLSWFANKKLLGKRIVVTRTREQAGELSKGLREEGAEVIELPTIRISPPSDERDFLESVLHAHTYNWLIFSSPNGVEKFFRGFFRLYRDIRSIGGVKIAAIGPSTAKKLAEYGLEADLVPEKNFVAEGLIAAFKKNQEKIGTVENLTMLWVRAEDARGIIAQKLTDMGAIVDECLAYKTEIETELSKEILEMLHKEKPDYVTFTSASTVKNFFALGGVLPEGSFAVSIGPITTEELKKQGVSRILEAKSATIPALIQVINHDALIRK